MKTLILVLFISEVFCLCIGNTSKHEENSMANNYVHADIMINEGQSLLKEGDLVVRLNRDPASQVIKNFNRSDKSYSHAGIVLYENGYPYVYHIVNGEENPGEKMRRDSMTGFCNPRTNSAYGIFRYTLEPGEVRSLKDLVHKWYIKGVQFDPTFNLATDDRMYCSEMISKALARSTHHRILVGTTKLNSTEARLFSAYMHLPVTYMSKLQVVAIDNLYKNSSCHLIKKYTYKP